MVKATWGALAADNGWDHYWHAQLPLLIDRGRGEAGGEGNR